MTVQTMLDMPSRRWRVCFAFCTLLFISSFDTIVVVVVVGDGAVVDDDDVEEERDEAMFDELHHILEWPYWQV